MINSKNIERIADILMDDQYLEKSKKMQKGIGDRIKLELNQMKEQVKESQSQQQDEYKAIKDSVKSK